MPGLSYLAEKIAVLIAVLIVLGSAVAYPTSGIANEPNLGKIEFPTSGAPEAQADFVVGVLYLHSFEYDLARQSFQQARTIDPGFAMAYWGEAMTHHHSLWGAQAFESAQSVLLRLGSTREDRAAKAPTEREKAYIGAVETLFGMTEETRDLGKLGRDVHYRNAMHKLHEAYPDDHEARAFYGLSILGVGSANREYAAYMRAAAILTPVWDANREHPGAAHYLIHSYDDPVHAILGLPMARAYGEIAVGAAHAQHMTSHIYAALGLWDDLIAANLTALNVESAKTVGEGAHSREAWHHRYWLHYGRLQQGRRADAEAILKWARDQLDNEPLPRERAYYGAMFARFLFDTESWDEADSWLAPEEVVIPSPHYNFARAFAAAKLGQLDKARKIAGEIRNDGLGNPEINLAPEEIAILQLELEAMFALGEDQEEKAVVLLREAVKQQTSMPFRYGPPRISKPSSELLGDLLLEIGRPEEAARAYKVQLSRTLRRTNSLLGLARAREQIGDKSLAGETYGVLAKIWHDSDVALPAVE